MKNQTLKLAAMATILLGTMIPITNAALHINISNDESGKGTKVTFSGSDTISGAYHYQSHPGGAIATFSGYGKDTWFVSYANDGGGSLKFDSITSVGSLPLLASFPRTVSITPEGAGTAGFEFSSNSYIKLYTSADQPGVVNWDSWFVIPQTVTQMGLAEGTSGEVFYYDKNGSLITSIGWSVGAPVPEPATYATIFGIVIAGATLVLRRCKR